MLCYLMAYLTSIKKRYNFLIRKDPKAKFRFISVQGESGQLFLKQLRLAYSTFDSLIFIRNDRYFLKSTAVLRTLAAVGNGVF